MNTRYLLAALLAVALASLLAAFLLLLRISELPRELAELERSLREAEALREQLLEELRGLGEQAAGEGRTAASGGARVIVYIPRAIVYILPSRACTPVWRERYGDRIYFYAYANVSEYRGAVEENFEAISLVYNTVVVVVPAEDTPLYFSNLRVVDELASRHGLRVMWALLPRWKYGPEEDYLKPGTRMNQLVLQVMSFLSGLNSTWRIAMWYGWEHRANASDLLSFYSALPDPLKPLYAAWIDQPYAEVVRDLAGRNPPFLVVTELYSEEALIRYSGLLQRQLVVTGYQGASGPEEWLRGVTRKLGLARGGEGIGI
ncbi:MAG: hypothetical protein ACO2OQ_04165 [Thermofilaceae archaeon]